MGRRRGADSVARRFPVGDALRSAMVPANVFAPAVRAPSHTYPSGLGTQSFSKVLALAGDRAAVFMRFFLLGSYFRFLF